MPKGARIGAYLESLRQSGLTGEPPEGLDIDDDKEDVADGASKGHCSLLRQAVKNQTEDPRVLKATNSSSGANRKDSGFRTPSPKPRSFRLQSSRSNPQRDNSPAPNLADLEFPPPPPPLDEGVGNDTSSECSSSGKASGRPHVTSPRGVGGGGGGGGYRDQLKSSSVNIQLRSSSADGRRFREPEATEAPDQFILGTEMSVEENSLKKNIRKSCESPNTTIESANSGGFVTSKSADSLVSSLPEMLPDDPASQPLMSQSMLGVLRSPSWADDNTTSSTPPPPEPTPVTAKDENNGTGSLSSLDCLSMNPPSVNLVSELFENLRLKAGKKPGSSNQTQTDADAKPKAPPPAFNPAASNVVAPPPKPTHPAPLPPKKIDLPPPPPPLEALPSHDDCDELPKFDFKSRLRKVNPAGIKIPGPLPQTNSTDSTAAAADAAEHSVVS